MHEEECPNCGEIAEVEVWEEGECDRCGHRYWWEEFLDEDGYSDGPLIVWDK